MSPRTACHRIHFPAAVVGLAVLVSFTCAHAAEENWTTVDAEASELGGGNHEKFNTGALRARATERLPKR